MSADFFRFLIGASFIPIEMCTVLHLCMDGYAQYPLPHHTISGYPTYQLWRPQLNL